MEGVFLLEGGRRRRQRSISAWAEFDPISRIVLYEAALLPRRCGGGRRGKNTGGKEEEERERERGEAGDPPTVIDPGNREKPWTSHGPWADAGDNERRPSRRPRSVDPENESASD